MFDIISCIQKTYCTNVKSREGYILPQFDVNSLQIQLFVNQIDYAVFDTLYLVISIFFKLVLMDTNDNISIKRNETMLKF